MAKKVGCSKDKKLVYRIKRKKDAPFRKNLKVTFVKDFNGKIMNYGTNLEAKIDLKRYAGGSSHYYETVPVCIKK